MKIKFTSFICCLLFSTFSYGQNNFWTDIEKSQITLPADAELITTAKDQRLLQLDFHSLKNNLLNVPRENEVSDEVFLLELPMPDGSFETFKVVESSVMEPELAAKFPEIKSYRVQGLLKPGIQGRFDCTYTGFNAYLRTIEGDIFISPYATNQQNYYASYYTEAMEDLTEANQLACGFQNPDRGHIYFEDIELEESNDLEFRNNTPVELRVYTVALACTGEYAANHGGTVESVMSSFNTAFNTINAIFENEVAVRLVLIANNEQLVFLNAGNDPYFNSNDGEDLLSQNTNVITNVVGIPLQAFDIGHVFTAGCVDGLGGIASFGATCGPNRGAGVTCHFSNNVAFMAREIMAHELAHQFAVSHSWNNCPTSLDQLASGWAYEPGSGSTIMSYSGSCGTQNIQSNSDSYYSVGSLQEFIRFSRETNGNECPTIEPTNNNEPIVTLNYTDGFFIPVSTPFELIAEASDPDGDDITYCWEQFDLGPVSDLGNPMGNAPLFRSRPPVNSPRRVFPRLSTIVANGLDLTEFLPTYSRDMTFRCTVRDNNPEAGGTVWETIAFESTASAGPFLVTSPNNGSEEWTVGDYVEVTWDVANTDNAKVNCKLVNILLSTDGGFNYPTVLEANVPNDGSHFVTVPDIVASGARIRIEAANNIFFDISNQNFDIIPASEPGYTLDLSQDAYVVCLPDVVELDLISSSILGFENSITLEIIDGLPAEAIATLSSETLNVDDAVSLTIDMPFEVQPGTYDIVIQATAEGVDTTYRTLTLLVTSVDFADLGLSLPVDGQTNIGFSTDFEWTSAFNADSYIFELATSPSFGNTIVESATGLTSNAYIPTLLFEENTIYFWRVKPINSCGEGEALPPFSFQTQSVLCSPSQADDVPINISGTGTPTVESEIFITVDGIISDVNIPFFKGSYQPVNSMRISLVSPIGTEVVLFDQNCGNTLKFELGFDDDAPNAIICPPDDGIIFQPVEPLSTFIGEGTQGTWTLKSQVVEAGFGGGGSIDSWNLEFCASFTPSNPFLIVNDTLFVPPAEANTITQSILEVQHNESTPEQLTYTLVSAPSNGTLFYAGTALEQGGTFRQASINAANLSYLHDGSDAELDHFLFNVVDGVGGWLPTQQFNIKIDENAVVNTNDLLNGNQIWVYPNPANETLNIEFENPVDDQLRLRLLNIHGQEVLSSEFENVSQKLEIPVNNLAAGTYAISIESSTAFIVKKIIIQH